MNPMMAYKDYLAALQGHENAPASLHVLLSPFKIAGVPSKEDEFLMVGHVLDAIAEENSGHKNIDAATVLEMALDLGLSA